MQLTEILNTTEVVLTPDQEQAGIGDTSISNITCDSRQVAQGALFIAVDGHTADGHDYISQAFDKGATAVLAQKIPQGLSREQSLHIVLSKNTRKDTAIAAANFFGHPSKDLVLVGITGTNGKTSITWLLEQIYQTCGITCGVIGTINIRYPGITIDNPITTPDAVCLQKIMHDMKLAGVTHVIMEVSSHSLDQHRVDECEFNAAVFTNLTQDHLDYHDGFENYFACKKTLFTEYLGPFRDGTRGKAVINIDNAYGTRLADSLDLPVIRVSADHEADIRAINISDDIHGLQGSLDFSGVQAPMHSRLTGRFNLENILCAAGAALATGICPESIARGIAVLERVPGRLEKLSTELNRHIFVDYAHTPDALESILKTLAGRAPARLITVFGCGGDRDRTKRGPMGVIACKYSDIAIVTSDNPRTENPDAIIDEIIDGIRAQGFKQIDLCESNACEKGYIRMTDRAKALALAVQISTPQDIIVAAGKGHETYQITNAGTIHFDDKEHLTHACTNALTPKPWHLTDLSKALGCDAVTVSGQKTVADAKATVFKGIGTDSRDISSDMVFLALAGDRFDGHSFIPDLAEKGVSAFVVTQGYPNTLDLNQKRLMDKTNACFFEVPDTLAALGHLARYHRMRSNVKIAALTGSNGKTSTRKMAEDIFSLHHDTLATRGNLNNEIGLPLTLLRLADIHEWAVVEMGMSNPGEISRLCAIARPDIALVTNTHGSHMEGVGSLDNVARAKAEIFDSLNPGGTAIIFADDPRIEILARGAKKTADTTKVMRFGTQRNSDVLLSQINPTDHGIAFSLTMDGHTRQYTVPSPADFMAFNAAAAAALAKAAGIDETDIAQGLEAFVPVQGRMHVRHLANGLHLIDDTYNANPCSMDQALKVLNRMAGTNRGIAVLGDMLELGDQTQEHHRQVGHLVAALSPAKLLLFGTQVAQIREGALEKGYPEARIVMGSKQEIGDTLKKLTKYETWVLIKGSRGMAMETLIPVLKKIPAERAN
ncbi:UDP-N-acetylmuramoyl-L-alanyl-D-glutamate--2,6-diaminopimelate ligase [Desulfobacter hydrogenophilus]|uniref:Multifunctional fusion protein n=1 Tax=Desulfobacter hydrogenophilus TaxID=2291 RepID=A0A328FCB9_9BACT|nr:UDP-N-acetylmuramoyl-L-alanyl-D-glutamate--2,6-diaminopimelate ligase [Desulfobacter hydrogenophilus]NDY73587.1 UDP-N-acetylmuramoyl-L-alanyl-D-glutamate--2,6-diaminopimelate ligase [Desulfobacter hydrogenophilus]QBH13680.1 UDP-N-acetylmuramoyl-L-alanyl-D-glutamate--2,6-diaminopimelate ligase [Desulfobacter hydrogenophilus]RAM01866.1 UDP-N-acetylmuramoyl-L-alanyl-D-glutamate--2,6-diaminopimelate ligase [Desulfobacter hydrogenophilus]